MIFIAMNTGNFTEYIICTVLIRQKVNSRNTIINVLTLMCFNILNLLESNMAGHIYIASEKHIFFSFGSPFNLHAEIH